MADEKWFQQVLLAEEVLEVRVRVGFIPSRDHGQWMVEVVDPTTDRLIDAISRPHFDLRRWDVEGPDFLSLLRTMLNELVEPF